MVDDVRPKPSCVQRSDGAPRAIAREVADGVERDLRVVGAGLDAEVAAGAVRVELVAGEAGRAGRAPAAAGAPSPKRPRREDAGPEAEGDREPRGRQAERLAGVDGRRDQQVVRPAERLAGASSRAAAAVQSRSSPASSVAVGERQVERAEDEPVLRGGGDPGLVLAVERDRSSASASRRRRAART